MASSQRAPRALALAAVAALAACGAGPLRRFPASPPLARDTDLRPTAHPPEPYVSPLAWDGLDNMLFRPLSDTLAVPAATEAANANALDEVADSAWFENRIGVRPMAVDELARGACRPGQVLSGEDVARGAWLVDQGKANGSSPGFRVRLPDKSKYMFKSDAPVAERPTAASVIGAAVYHAVGFHTSCEQIVYFDPAALTLAPGLTVTDNTGITRPFDRAALDALLARATHQGARIRMQASAWLAGKLLGPFRYEGTRADDPNDVLPHEDRRELRGGRLLAAWLHHIDAREQNTMDTWIAEDAARPEGPGHVRHHYLDTSDCFGTEWDWDGVSRRLGHSYLLDWGDVGLDFVTLGIPSRPWDEVARTPGQEVFGYFDVAHFDPSAWKNEYPNPAFSRMTERDGAWMARILARFRPEDVRALAGLGRFADPRRTAYLAAVLEGRLAKILARYLGRLSPLADVRTSGDRLCATDLARARAVWPAAAFRYAAELRPERGAARALAVEPGDAGAVCVTLPHGAGEYVVVRLANGAAPGPLDVHLYDRGAGFVVAGLERPAP